MPIDNDQSKTNTLHHDIRNHLNRISMQTELAKMLLEQGADTNKILDILEPILKACSDCDTQLQASQHEA